MSNNHSSNKKKTRKNNNIDWKTQLFDLTCYVNKKYKYDVQYSSIASIDFVDYKNKTVTICSSHSDEKATYVLLHELGHIVQTNKNPVKYDRTIGSVLDGFSNSSLTYRIGILNEEFDAWNNAIELADSLDIPIRKKQFEIFKSQCLKTYVDWVGAHRKRTRKKDEIVTNSGVSTISNVSINDESVNL